MKHLEEYKQQKKLISIRRDELDANSIEGFILGLSEDLILLQYVYDFRLDGLVVLRKSDITEIKCNATNKFQKTLLIAEGLFQQVPFHKAFKLDSWKLIIGQFMQEYKLVILENEYPDSEVFLIGKIQKITQKNVVLSYFTGAGNWEEKPSMMVLDEITSCKVDTNYLNVYQRYFDRD